MGNVPDSLYQSVGMSGLIQIIFTLVCITASWWALQSVRFDLWLKSVRSPQAIMLQVILSVVLGYQLARFLYDYANWSSMLKLIFE
ncbi:DUF1146 domain-containing protein [Xylanibacillus composti]|uniref:Putative membrane protein YwzB n=1 Tax=Xylanibacillus composti TaxID=1572762 RepID=A0A8J4H6Q4_9BACL|nr:DUF1146 family protein [Xylanibacillus composti]MDT9725975.1 DUF1146 domain-containing protein [Xylanibacillus composti]GIQ70871.1 putative membrane protein YwzB [Xylanibacillus composti]